MYPSVKVIFFKIFQKKLSKNVKRIARMFLLNNRKKSKEKKIKAKDKNFNCNLFVTSYKGNKKKDKKVICRNYFFFLRSCYYFK